LIVQDILVCKKCTSTRLIVASSLTKMLFDNFAYPIGMLHSVNSLVIARN